MVTKKAEGLKTPLYETSRQYKSRAAALPLCYGEGQFHQHRSEPHYKTINDILEPFISTLVSECRTRDVRDMCTSVQLACGWPLQFTVASLDFDKRRYLNHWQRFSVRFIKL
ncbi:hypothetical protein J6590_030286 [Homalodisca vitripennis]|nr:hypothetical protein J6590_030286 [Homalodisca vitripennis]